MNGDFRPIGFLDSGIGGLSVLREAQKLMPNENYIYFGDSKNAPYGTKEKEEIKKLTYKATEFLMGMGVKAIVVACNTATSAAIDTLRSIYNEDIPIIGIEPAIKPAALLNKEGKILLLATPMTLKLDKLSELIKKYNGKKEIVLVPCEGLVEYIEKGIIEGEEVNNYLKGKLSKYLNDNVSAIVLGCTHYPFIKKELKNIIGDIFILDGSIGTVRNLMNNLERRGLLNYRDTIGKTEIYNSLQTDEIIKLSFKLLNND